MKYGDFVQIDADRALSDADESFLDTLCRRVALARDELLKHEIEANTVVLDSYKFGKYIRPGSRPTIFGMKVEFASLPDEYDFLVQYRAPEIQTNGDLLRGMDDEHLAEWIAERIDCSYCDMCKIYGPNEAGCEAQWLRYLRSPAGIRDAGDS